MIKTELKSYSYKKINSMVLIAIFTALTCVGGFIRIPMLPVPFSLQTLFVYFSGLLLGAQRSFLSQMLFLLMGLAGIPVFIRGGGPAYVLQPSFGYLAAFPLSAYVCGKISHDLNNHNFFKLLIACGSGSLIILGLGSLYLYLNFNYIIDTSIGFRKTLITGFLVFLPAETVKCFITVWITRKIIKIPVFNELISK
ncbi:MAG: biotin transporter BioY [bacterium]